MLLSSPQPQDIVDLCQSAGVRLSVTDGRIRAKAATGKLDPELVALLTRHKAAVIACLSSEPAQPLRSIDDYAPLSEGSIDIPRNWRSILGTWPIERWIEWRRRSGEIQAAELRSPTVESIDAADRRAFDELRAGASNAETAEPRVHYDRDSIIVD
jgi:hypothetical protein